jgi:hypothetical protein
VQCGGAGDENLAVMERIEALADSWVAVARVVMERERL